MSRSSIDLKAWRKARRPKLTQTQAAALFDVRLRTWRSYEYGHRKPPKLLEILIKIKENSPDVVLSGTYCVVQLECGRHWNGYCVVDSLDPTALTDRFDAFMQGQLLPLRFNLVSVHMTLLEANDEAQALINKLPKR